MPSFIEIRPLITEISRRAKQVLTDGRRTDEWPENMMPPLPVVGGGIKMAANIAVFVHVCCTNCILLSTFSFKTRQVKTGDVITADRPDAWHVTGT